MEMYKGSIASKSKKGNSMKGDDNEWYSLFSAEDFVGEWKDSVEFLWEYDKSGKYRNIKKGTMKLTGIGGSAGGTAGATAGRAPYKANNIGVELGHASNNATQMALAWASKNSTVIGSPEFYKFWLDTTQDIYQMMKGLRASHEEGGLKVADVPAPAAPVAAPVVTDSDLF
jgi:hypothetical protein